MESKVVLVIVGAVPIGRAAVSNAVLSFRSKAGWNTPWNGFH
jgi:hypothetical protein